MRGRPAARSWRRLARAAALAGLGGVVAAGLAAGCGGGGGDGTTGQSSVATRSTTLGTAPSTQGADKGAANTGAGEAPKSGGGAPPTAALTSYSACLQRHGATLPTPGGSDAQLPRLGRGKLKSTLGKFQAAAQACRGQLPEHAPPGMKHDLQRAGQSAADQLQRVDAFRACMGRHGFGPDARGNAPQGDVGSAFADCRSELPASQQR